MAIPLSLNLIYFRANGCNPMASVFDTALRNLKQSNEQLAYNPAYNIVKQGEHDYAITLAVAGFAESDLSITAKQNTLVVSGQHDESATSEEADYLHQGFSKQAFESTFRLGEHMKVKQAQLKDGLLHIHLVRDVPEESKPQTIPIVSADAAPSKRN